MKSHLTSLVVTALSISIVASAHSGATGVIKERMDGMNAMATHAKNIADMFKGKAAFNLLEVRAAARSFIDHGQPMVGLFPDTEFSRTGKYTQALPAIWNDAQGFDKSVQQFVLQSEKLLALTETTSDQVVLKKQFFVAAKGCSDCHKRFRKPKQ